MNRKPVWFTFGNHMHWVDMQWLWGYDVLPGSVRDMLRLCREAGVKGNVNFDGIGYEKMAAECPDALAELREAIAAGIIEPVGCSYGQPYGLFNGGESNIRQRVFGVRTVMRLLGVRPRGFWEEEFDFFPQLPQMLAGCGFTGACLFFQWTWHTPEVPMEEASLIQWEGVDGTRLPCLPRNELNLHQWPEDFAPLFASKLLRDLDKPAIVQWVELMPSRDWMCRSEVLLPKLKELLAKPEYEIRPGTLSQVIGELTDSSAPVRRYSMDDVWHGVSLGKNGDRHPRASRSVERTIQLAESTSALAGLFGRPYPSWDVYPTWEIDEAWRELLAAQHHDNHECEGLCGSIGHASFDRAHALAGEVVDRNLKLLGRRAGRTIEVSHVGWATDLYGWDDKSKRGYVAGTIPPFGYASRSEPTRWMDPVQATVTDQEIVLRRGRCEVVINRATGLLTRFVTPTFDTPLFRANPQLSIQMIVGGQIESFTNVSVSLHDEDSISIERRTRDGKALNIHVRFALLLDAIDISFTNLHRLPRPDGGMNAGVQWSIGPGIRVAEIRSDSPHAISPVKAVGRFRRKYPTGDWMTSPQWFEEVVNPFTAYSLADMLDERGYGLLVLHSGSQQFFRDGSSIRSLLNLYDPWDEDRYAPHSGYFHFRLLPHGPMRNAERARLAAEFGDFIGERDYGRRGERQIPECFGGLEVTNAPNVLATSFHRESMKAGENLAEWAGHEIFRRSDGACTHPYVIRLVEYDGDPADVVLKLPGEIAMAAKTNLMGETQQWLTPEPISPPEWAKDAKIGRHAVEWSALRFTMRPLEIATIMADLVLGRKQFRDLDAKREIWATVHRT